jgi:Ca-activated chloride channel family protein
MGPFEVTLEVAQDPYLASDQSEMHVVLRVTAQRSGGSATGTDAATGTGATDGPGLAEVLLIDCSGSMGTPSTKLAAAKRAVRAALKVLPDGTRFAIVRGFMVAEMVYPTDRKLATLDASTRAAAGDAVNRVYTSGGTRMSEWLTLGRQLLEPHTTSVRHALLLTDGQNVHDTADALTSVLAECSGRFVCDPRGVGDDWEPAELKRIAAELRGTAQAVARPNDLADDFRHTIQAVTGKVVPDLRLRISTSNVDRLAFCRQTYPTIAEIAGAQRPHDDGPVEISLGAWGNETREYHLRFTVRPDGRPFEEDLRVARLDVVADIPLVTAPVLVLVHWTDDDSLTGRGDRSVTFVSNQQELAAAMNAGYTAALRGDRPEAERRFGAAVKLATEMGEAGKLQEMSKVVRIIDAARGEVELRSDVQTSQLLGGSIWSDRMPQLSPMPSERATPGRPAPESEPSSQASPQPPALEAGEAPANCPNPSCGEPVPNPALGFCPFCGRRLRGGSAPDASAEPGPDA